MFAAIFNSVLITKSSLRMAETRGRLSSPVTQKARGRTFGGLVNSLLIDGIEDPGPSHLSAVGPLRCLPVFTRGLHWFQVSHSNTSPEA